MQFIFDIAVVALRILLPVYAVAIVLVCYISMRRQRRPKKPLLALESDTGEMYPVLYWENSIGRGRGCDITVSDQTVSRDHCVLLRREEGWFVVDTNSKSGTRVNGKPIKNRVKLFIDDTITIGSTALTLKRGSEYDEDISRPRAGGRASLSSFKLMLLVTVFHFLMAITACFTAEVSDFQPLMIWGLFALISWGFYFVSTVILNRIYFELEALALFLSGIGILLLTRQSMTQALVQTIACAIGIVGFMIIIKFMENPDRLRKWRVAIMAASVVLLAINLIFGKTEYGSTNWIQLGPITVQPSEIVKIALIMVGAATLDQLQTSKNLLQFIIFSAICVGALALMGDFGTALIFFATFLMLAFMRSGSFKTLILAISAAGLAGVMVLKFKPYVLSRFQSWGHVWEQAQDGAYQQARVLTYTASGGLFGVGVGNGCLKYVFASESDLVFGIMSEELGIIIALAVAAAIAGLVFYARNITTRSRSSVYSISACCAAGLLVVQMSLNIFGATDILPLTGVTLPFISLGGTSMVSCWGLLAFIKAADEHTYSLKRR